MFFISLIPFSIFRFHFSNLRSRLLARVSSTLSQDSESTYSTMSPTTLLPAWDRIAAPQSLPLCPWVVVNNLDMQPLFHPPSAPILPSTVSHQRASPDYHCPLLSFLQGTSTVSKFLDPAVLSSFPCLSEIDGVGIQASLSFGCHFGLSCCVLISCFDFTVVLVFFIFQLSIALWFVRFVFDFLPWLLPAQIISFQWWPNFPRFLAGPSRAVQWASLFLVCFDSSILPFELFLGRCGFWAP